MKNNNLRKNKVLNAIVIFALFFLQSNFTYAAINPNALPNGYTIINGSPVIVYNGHVLDITAPNNTIINWNSFNIGQNSAVYVIQPNSSSQALMRIGNTAYLNGFLTNNGRLTLVDTNGIFFGAHSQINSYALLASTLDISNKDFLAGNYNFYQNGKSSWIINKGNIHISNGGYVVLLSNAISNSGVIEAKLGRVLLAAGEKMTVALDDDNDVSVTINDAVSNGVFGPDGVKITQAIQNSGSILADGGSILLDAKILNGIFDNAINNSGVIQANSLVNNNGSIEIIADGGNVLLSSGSLTSAKASDSTAEGGNITINSTNDTDIQSGATIDVSGGSLSGDAGSVDISAQGDVDLEGTLNGQAADGYNLGNFTIDPTNATIGSFNSTFLGNVTVWATNNITIVGNVFELGGNLNLYADHNSNVSSNWNNVSGGVGTITDAGNYTIYGVELLPITLNLEAGSGIGSLGSPIKISGFANISAQINPNAGMGSGGIYISDKNIIRPLNITSAATDGGDIDIFSQYTGITIAGAVDAGTGNVTLDAGTNIDQTNSAALVTGNFVTLDAVDGIGSINSNTPIDTAANTLYAYVTNLGGSININQTGDVYLRDIETNGGAINITGSGAMTADWVTSGAADISLTAAGNLWLANIYAGTGNVNLTSQTGSILDDYSHVIGNDVTFAAATGIGQSGTGPYTAINTTANTINANVSGAGLINLNNENTGIGGVYLENLTTANGDITVTADGTIYAGTVNAGSSNVNLTATDIGNGGSILDEGSLITGNVVTLIASDGIGDAPLNTTANTINADVTGTGLINLNNENTSTNGVYLQNLTTANGDITVTADGTIYAGTVNAGSSDVNLTATDIGNGGSILDEGSMITGNNVTLTASDGIGDAPLNTAANTLYAYVTNLGGSININQTGDVYLRDIETNGGAINITGSGAMTADWVTSGAADISLTAAGNLWLANIYAGTGNVNLTSQTGSILDDYSHVIGNDVTFAAATGIGQSGTGPYTAINTTANTINAFVWSLGGLINLNNVSNNRVTLGKIRTHDGDITITANGSINANDVKSHGGNINLTARRNISVGIVNAGWGDVALKALHGFISADWFRSLVTGKKVSLDAKKGIGNGRHAIKTDAKYIVANVWGRHGSINIDDVNSRTVTLEYVSTNDGNINIKSNGTIDAKDVKSRGGNIDLTAKRNIIVGNINAGWGNVYLTAVFGYIEGAWNSFINAGFVSLNAKRGIGNGRHAIKTDARYIVANVWGHRGSINIDDVNSRTVTLEYVSTNGGRITINSNGTIDAKDVKSRGGIIDLIARKNIIVGDINAGWGSVFLTSIFGYIEGGWNSFINANFLSLSAKKGIGNRLHSIKTDARYIVANVWGHRGSINIDDVNSRTVTLEYVSTNDGNINIKSNGTIDAKDVKSRGGNIDLTARKNIIVGNINAGWGSVYLTAVFGYIEGAWNSFINANFVSLDAKKGIGNGRHAIKTDARYIVANVWGQHGSINIDDVNSRTVTLEYVSTNDGRITINSNGTIDAKDVQSRGGNIDLTARKNIIVGDINADWGNVFLTALTGYIEGTWNSFIGGNLVVLDAKKGIGNGRHAIRMFANYIVANVWGRHGSINIDDISAGTVTLEYISTNDGRITINSNGYVDAKDVQSRGGNIDITTKGSIKVGYINAGWGNVFLTSIFGYIEGGWNSFINANFLSLSAKKGIGNRLHSIKTDARYIVANVWGHRGSINIDDVNSRTVTLEYVSTNDGNINIKSNGTIDAKDVKSRGGNIDLTARKNIIVGNINAGWGSVYLTAVFGYIEGAWNSFINANFVSLDAKKGIGNGRHAIKTDARYIVANVWGHQGSINIDDVNSRTVTLEYVSTNDGNININSNGTIDAKDVKSHGGDIDLTAKNDINAGIIDAGQGYVILTSEFGSILSTWFNSLVTGYVVSLNAATGIGSSTKALNTSANEIYANVTGTGLINLNNKHTSVNGVTLESLTTTNGDITVTADGTMNVGTVNAGSSDVTLTANNGGSILYDATLDSLITGNIINLTADGDIGSSLDNIVTDSSFLNVTSNDGNVYLDSTGVEINLNAPNGSATLLTNNGTILDDITTGGDFTLTALSGDVTISGTVDSTGGGVGILVDDGSILADPGSNVIANADSFFNTPNGIIGTDADPVNVDINGNLVLAIGTKVGFNSGFLTGTVTGKGHIPLVTPATYAPLDPPGNIFFNGIRIWPTRFEFALSQGASGLTNHFVFPSAEQLAFTQVNTFDPSTSSDQTGGSGLFLYHPLEDVDSGAFDQEFQLDEGAYDFIDGQIAKKP